MWGFYPPEKYEYSIFFYHLYKPRRNEAVLLVSDVLNS